MLNITGFVLSVLCLVISISGYNICKSINALTNEVIGLNEELKRNY